MILSNELSAIRSVIDQLDLDEHAPLCAVELYVLCLEDRRYLCHPGIDILGIIRAIACRTISGKLSGASTIEQQLVRTITGRKEKTASRKFREAITALWLSRIYSKKYILRAYLSLAYMGWNKHGAHNTAQALFNKNYDCLTDHSAAKIAALLVYPMPRYFNEAWQRRIDQRIKYGFWVWERIKCATPAGPFAVYLKSTPPVISCASLRYLLQRSP